MYQTSTACKNHNEFSNKLRQVTFLAMISLHSFFDKRDTLPLYLLNNQASVEKLQILHIDFLFVVDLSRVVSVCDPQPQPG